MDENKNTENIEKSETEEAAESAVEEIDESAAEERTAAAEVTKTKSKMFILYICALVVFMAVAVTALVCFGLYANNLVHGEDESALMNYSAEYADIGL